jgi:predicted O-methyltransferase YrrM
MSEQAAPVFSQDWFSRSIPAWRAVLDGLSKRNPAMLVLEVGVFEGRSTCWLLENFCRTADCGIVAVDSFTGGEEHRGMQLGGLRGVFERNVAAMGSACPVEVRQGDSLTQLCRLVVEEPARFFDFISIDASHRACDVIGDAVLAFRLLKPGGVIAFDDYLWSPFRRGAEDPLSTPKMAVDAFTTLFARQARVLAGLPLYQLYVQKSS